MPRDVQGVLSLVDTTPEQGGFLGYMLVDVDGNVLHEYSSS